MHIGQACCCIKLEVVFALVYREEAGIYGV